MFGMAPAFLYGFTWNVCVCVFWYPSSPCLCIPAFTFALLFCLLSVCPHENSVYSMRSSKKEALSGSCSSCSIYKLQTLEPPRKKKKWKQKVYQTMSTLCF